ncbi:hypothetical protein IPF37_06740 [bacterium]|nr:MAG: hypothetical protein IPF37_06740 [bacterium]
MNMKNILALALAFCASQSGLQADSARLINTVDNPRKLFTKHVQVGQSDEDALRKNLEVTNKTFCRKGVVIGSGGQPVNDEGTLGAGPREEIFNLPFNPSTQLLCLEFNQAGQDGEGAYITEVVYCGHATSVSNEFSDNNIPVISFTRKIVVNNGYDFDASDRWGSMRTVNTATGDDELCGFPGAGLNDLVFTSLPVPTVTNPNPNPTNKKVYLGLYTWDQKEFYLQNYPFIFQNGGEIFINIKSCNLYSVSVIDLPNENFNSFQAILQNKILEVLSGYSIFQIWALADQIVANEYAATLTNLLLVNTEESIAEACAYIQNLACNLFGCA